jgi:hypothetical protein
VAADAFRGEVVTGAGPLALPVGENVVVVVTPELDRELGELDPVLLLCVALGFLDLAD